MFYIMFNCDLISTWGSVDDIFRRCLELGGDQPNNWLEFWNSRKSCKSYGLYFSRLLFRPDMLMLSSWSPFQHSAGLVGCENQDAVHEACF